MTAREELAARLTEWAKEHEKRSRELEGRNWPEGENEMERAKVCRAAAAALLAAPEPNGAHYFQTRELTEAEVRDGYKEAQQRLAGFEAEMVKRGFLYAGSVAAPERPALDRETPE